MHTLHDSRKRQQIFSDLARTRGCWGEWGGEGQGRGAAEGLKKLLRMMDIFTILTMAVVSCIYSCMFILCVQFIEYQLLILKTTYE